MIEYALAVSLVWASPDTGQIKSYLMTGQYKSHQACVQALTGRIEKMRYIYGVAPVPTGTVMCEAKERLPMSPEIASIACGAAAAAAAAGASVSESWAASEKKAKTKAREAEAYKNCISENESLKQ